MFQSINPLDGKLVAEYPEMSSETVDDILESAQQAQQQWRNVPFAERRRFMLKAADLLLDNKQAYAQMMTAEMGKIAAQGIAEIEKCAWVCRFYAEQAEGFLRQEDIDTEAHHSFVTYNPLGVILAVMPWNYPFWQAFRFAAPGLMAAWSEELFGPVATLIRVTDEAEAIRVANDTDFGLSGSVWTQDLARGERIAAYDIESGASFVNDMSKSDPRMPFGGIRQSGYGRELGLFGIREFVNIHSVWVTKR